MRRFVSAGRFHIAVAAGCLAALLAADALAEASHMRKALDHLEKARQELEQAEAGKGGHRAKAREYVDKAIDQVQQGIEYSKDQKDE